MLLAADTPAVADDDAKDMAELCIVPILYINSIPAMKLDNAARLYPMAKNLGGVRTLLLSSLISLESDVPSSLTNPAISSLDSDISSSPLLVANNSVEDDTSS